MRIALMIYRGGDTGIRKVCAKLGDDEPLVLNSSGRMSSEDVDENSLRMVKEAGVGLIFCSRIYYDQCLTLARKAASTDKPIMVLSIETACVISM